MRPWSLRILRQISLLALSLLQLLVAATAASFKSRTALKVENLALRHQLAVLRRSVKRPKLIPADRLLWPGYPRLGLIGAFPCSSSSRKQSLAGTARVFGCSGPGKFVVGNPEDQPFRRMCANSFGS